MQLSQKKKMACALQKALGPRPAWKPITSKLTDKLMQFLRQNKISCSSSAISWSEMKRNISQEQRSALSGWMEEGTPQVAPHLPLGCSFKKLFGKGRGTRRVRNGGRRVSLAHSSFPGLTETAPWPWQTGWQVYSTQPRDALLLS